MSAEPYRILVVDDNDADVYLLRKAFENAGLDAELTVIEDGEDALAYVRGEGKYGSARRPHAALLDLNLPKNEGTEVLEALRASSRLATVPVVVLTSSASPADELRITNLRVDRFITKPPNLEDFLQIGAVVSELLVRAKGQEAP
jgi:CheY-like chemotaxis protein